MTEKDRTSITLDADLLEEFRESEVALSPLVNRWAREYLETGAPSASQTDIAVFRDALDELEAEAKSDIEGWFDTLREALPDPDDGTTDVGELNGEVDEVYDLLTTVAFEGLETVATQIDPERSPRAPDDEAVRTQARKLGITPQRLVDELERRDEAFASTPTPPPDSEVEQHAE